jgi:hypothetical protein
LVIDLMGGGESDEERRVEGGGGESFRKTTAEAESYL